MTESILRPPSAAPHTSAKRILVIDDDNDFRGFICRSLKPPTFDVRQACGGSEGLGMARRSPPDLVVLDLAMPGLNGLETCRRLRASPETSRVPVLIMTGMLDTARLLHSAVDAVAADGLLSKPFLRSEFLREVDRLLQPRPATAPAALSPADPLILTRGRVRLDLTGHRVWVGGRELKSLGPKRFRLLTVLLRHPEGVSREQLLAEVWGGLADFDRSSKTVDIMVHRLRADLSFRGRNPIVAVPGGYKLAG